MATSSAFRSSRTPNRPDRQVLALAHGYSSSSSSSNSSSVVGQIQQSVRQNQKVPASRRIVTPNARTLSVDDDKDSQRVRVAVRLRPRNADEILSDADFADYIELQSELKRLKLRKNNWSFESYRFDEVFTETASQRRVYEVVAKPVVESVLSGYNGTIMAYGQTGTGKTYTVGRLGKDDASERGIMVRAVEDILANISTSDSVEVSYFQLYMESIQDLLAPEKSNISIQEDPKSGEVSLPGAEVVKVRDLDNFMQLLQLGEANRYAANTKLNTESSRSHAILMVHIRRSIPGKKVEDITCQEKDTGNNPLGVNDKPMIQKSKLLIVDLAGSERIDKSGSEGHLLEEAKFINLSLTSLGKCINALAEKSPHIPTRESKLTRLLRDSFGGSARTSLVITIGPSSQYHAETASTIMFGQRAMKIVNMVKLREEVDYESLCRKLENQVDLLTAEVERQQKLRDNDKCQLENQLKECQGSLVEMKKNLDTRSEFLEKENIRLEVELKDILDELRNQKDHNDLMQGKVALLEKQNEQYQLENSAYQKVLAETTQMYEKKIAELIKQIEENHSSAEHAAEELDTMKKLLNDHQKSRKIQGQEKIDELRERLQGMSYLHETTANELQLLQSKYQDLSQKEVTLNEELNDALQRLYMEEKQRKAFENELIKLKKNVLETKNDVESLEYANCIGSLKSKPSKETISCQKAALAKICKEVGFQRILELLKSEDLDIQIHALKVIANLAAEAKRMFKFCYENLKMIIEVINTSLDINQERIVEEGGLDALLTLLQSSKNTTILRVASGAIANLAMNEINQGLIVSKGGTRLLAETASRAVDPQTLRMVAGALANLCGNESLHMMLNEDGGIKALLEMVTCGNTDVVAQVARGIANFAKCEFKGIIQGQRKGCSVLVEHGALSWLIANSNTTSASTRRHIELALCHLAQNGELLTRQELSSREYYEAKMNQKKLRNCSYRHVATFQT